MPPCAGGYHVSWKYEFFLNPLTIITETCINLTCDQMIFLPLFSSSCYLIDDYVTALHYGLIVVLRMLLASLEVLAVSIAKGAPCWQECLCVMVIVD